MSNNCNKFYRPSFVVQNLSNKAVRVLGSSTIQPGEIVDLYEVYEPEVELFEDIIHKALEEPWGDLYREVEVKKSLKIIHCDLVSWHYSIVGPHNITANNSFFPGAVPVAVDDETFSWIDANSGLMAQEPISISSSTISIPPAGNGVDGYLTAADWARFDASVKPDLDIWQYQDFAAPLGSSITLSAFENGTSVFNPLYIIDNTAVATLTNNNSAPPTTTNSIPAKYLPSNRVSVSSHIGTTVTLDGIPEASQNVRIYYLIRVPSEVKLPVDYQEDPEFLNDLSLDFVDENYVNQNAIETIYGEKTFDDQSIHSNSIRIPVGAGAGKVLTSIDGFGNAVWSAPSGDGYWVSDDGIDIYNNNAGSVGIGTSNVDGYAQLEVASNSKGILIPRLTESERDSINNNTNGLIVFNTDDNRINLYDGYIGRWVDTSHPTTSTTAPTSPYPGQVWLRVPDYNLFIYDPFRGKWLSPSVVSTSASRNAINASNIYLRTADGGATNIFPYVLPFDATLIGISASGELAQTWTVEVRVGNSLVPGASLTINNSRAFSDYSLNVDFAANSEIQIFLNSSSGIRRPRANLFFAKRG